MIGLKCCNLCTNLTFIKFLHHLMMSWEIAILCMVGNSWWGTKDPGVLQTLPDLLGIICNVGSSRLGHGAHCQSRT